MKTWHVPDMEARLETLRLWRDYDRLHKARETEESGPSVELYQEYQARLDEVRRWYDAELVKQVGQSQSAASYVAARDAYFEAPGCIEENDDGEPMFCVVTGAPIMEADEVVETGDGSLILASAFVPREILDQFSGEKIDTERAA